MNSFGRIYRMTSFGESHGAGIGVVIDGCPAGLELDLERIQAELDRRKPGQNRLTTQRKESDTFQVLSGLVGHTTSGAPLAFFVPNEDQRSKDYDHIEQVFRPSHADYTYFSKYGIRDHRGGGRSSARETIARVIAGAVARQALESMHGIRIDAWVSGVGLLDMAADPKSMELETEDARMVRCPDRLMASQMVAAIDAARKAGDSLGGRISCRVSGVPAGIGAPIYDKLSARLAYAMMGINAVKGFEIGSGFDGSTMTGSSHNDAFVARESGGIGTESNRSGGIQGGISNGEPITFRVAFKPTSTIMRDQQSVDASGEAITVKGKGRHDPCVVPRAVPIVEAMAAVVLLDQILLARSDKM